MDGIATRVFLIETSATAAQVWAALTRPDQTVRYFNGLAIESTWRPGSSVGFGSSDPCGLEGEVLVVHEPRRLSYTLTSGPGQPTTYITWELDGGGDTTFVRLYVDEPDSELESATTAWLQIVGDLESLLGDASTPRCDGQSRRAAA